MAATHSLAILAADIAESAQVRGLNIEAELRGIQQEQAEIDRRKAKLLAERDAASFAQQRFADFEKALGSDLYCPHCAIGEGRLAKLTPIAGGTDTEDFFRCSDCDTKIGIVV